MSSSAQDILDGMTEDHLKAKIMEIAEKRSQALYAFARNETIENQNIKDLLKKCSERKRVVPENHQGDQVERVLAKLQSSEKAKL